MITANTCATRKGVRASGLARHKPHVSHASSAANEAYTRISQPVAVIDEPREFRDAAAMPTM